MSWGMGADIIVYSGLRDSQAFNQAESESLRSQEPEIKEKRLDRMLEPNTTVTNLKRVTPVAR
jgi:hypothetical protein